MDREYRDMALAMVKLRGAARRFSRRRDEAEDLLQDALSYGRFRRALRRALARRGGRLGTHDPDGHLLLISGAASQSGGWRQP